MLRGVGVRCTYLLATWRGQGCRGVSSSAAGSGAFDLARVRTGHPSNNVAQSSLLDKLGRGLYLQPTHPLGQVAARIRHHFAGGAASRDGQRFDVHDRLDPIVTVRQNFDELLTPTDHVSRRPSDTYYVDADRVLRCHMTAHQTEIIRAGARSFLMMGDVFRRDEVDATHYPVFHQVDGVRIFDAGQLAAAAGVAAGAQAVTAFVVADLKFALEGMVRTIFGPAAAVRWIDAYFPFTEPSFEMEVMFEGRWLEVLGCGMMRNEILASCGLPATSRGWAFGMGLERLAMVVFGIPDIRLFWSSDPRFLGQFQGGAVKFKPYSKFPGCYKDVTFWVPAGYHDNDFFELVRDVAGDMAEAVTVIDRFTHPKTGRQSRCYRVLYRHMDRNLTNAEVDELQQVLRARVPDSLRGELR